MTTDRPGTPHRLIGAGGGSGGKGGSGGSSRTPKTAPDSLDSRQYANVIDLISEGEIEGLVDGLKSIYLNNTVLQNPDGSFNFEDVEVYTRNGTQAQTYIPLSSNIEDEKPVGITVVKDVPITRSITDPEVDAVRVSISIPTLQQINKKNGDTLGSSVQLSIAIQYQGGGFTTVISDTITGRTADEYRKEYLIALARPRPSDNVDIKVTRITADSTDTLLQNAFAWSSYTEIIWAKLRYPNTALVALRVDAEQFNSIPTRAYLVKGIKVAIPNGLTVDSTTGRLIYPTNFIWDGTFAAATWTSCPAWILWDLLTNTRYGFGDHIDIGQLDKWAFLAASKYSNALVDDGFGGQEARFSCNTTIQTSEEAYKLVNDLLSIMRCQAFWSLGSLTVAQDAPADAVYLFTQANVSPDGFSYSSSSLKTRPTVAVVSYLDLNLRDTAYEVVEDTEGIDKYGVVRTEVSAFACTSRGQANRIGRWLLYSERYEKEVCTFVSSLDAGQQVRPGQIILISDSVRAGARVAGRISSATTTTITVDDTEETTLNYTTQTYVNVILPDGSAERRLVANIVGAVITVTSPFSAAPNPNSLWLIEHPSLEASTWRVLSVQEQEGLQYAITALSHNESKYAYIEDGSPLQQRDVTELNTIPAQPTGLAILETPRPSGGTTREVQYELNGRVAVKITFHWYAPSGIKRFRVKYRHEDDNFTTTTIQGTTFDILDAKPGIYQVQVSSISSSGLLFSEPALADYDVQGLGDPPASVSGLTLVPINQNTAILNWNQSDDLDVRVGGRVIIRHDPRTPANADWNASNNIVAAVAGSSTQKQVPLLPGTYLLKFEDFLGNRSTVAATVEATLPQFESRITVKTWEEHNLSPAFKGTGINGAYDAGETAFVLSPDPYVEVDYWDAIYAIGDCAAEYYFYDTFDLGDVYDVAVRRRILSRPLISSSLFDSTVGLFDEQIGNFDGSDSDGINVTTYIRTTPDDPAGTPTWSPWSEFVNGVVQGRAVQLKAVLVSESVRLGIAIDELGATAELVRRSTTNSALLTATASSYPITFDYPFYQAVSPSDSLYTLLPTVTINPRSLGLSNYYSVTAITRTGFTVTFQNTNNPAYVADDYWVVGYTDTDGQNFDYTATGYGRAL